MTDQITLWDEQAPVHPAGIARNAANTTPAVEPGSMVGVVTHRVGAFGRSVAGSRPPACSSEGVIIRSVYDSGFAHAERMSRRELKRYLRACRQMRADERLTRSARHDAWCEAQWEAIGAGVLW